MFTSIIFSQGNKEFKLKTVVIDAGHGGKDPGAVCKLGTEKALVLDLALRVGALINKNFPEIKVVYTRKTDVFVELINRAKIANDAKADLFLSIHANANKSSTPSGTESYILGLHRSKENFDLAMRENAVILEEDNYAEKYEGFDPNSPESYIIFSLLQNVFYDQSIMLASSIQDQYRVKAVRPDRGVKQLGLMVLARASMPSMLTEVGFISNLEEAKYLYSEQGKEEIAAALFKGIKDYKDLYEGRIKDLPDRKVLKPEIVETTENQTIETVINNKQEVTEVNSIVEFPKITEETKPTETEKPKTVLTEDSIYFKVQIAISKEKIYDPKKKFKNIENIYEVFIENLYKYYVGNTTNYNKAIELQKEIRKIIPDAFVVAYQNEKKIPINEALKKIKH
jgi:N-acetylmuramoyl-L-alanine amidase